MKSRIVGVVWTCATLCAPALAQEDWSEHLSAAVTGGTASLDFRYRFEFVDQEGFDKDAEASLLRSRLTLESAEIANVSGLFQVDNISSIGPNDYNSTENGKTEFPVVADPEGTEVNQAYLKYSEATLTAIGGRQEILMANFRFVGIKPQRQNVQTYDGVRFLWNPVSALKVDAVYAYNINRVFGPDDGGNPADWEGDNVFLLADYQLRENHRLSGYGYRVDVEEQGGYTAGQTVNNSSATLGIEYRGQLAWLDLRASWARQNDAGASELDYEADYYVVELGAKWAGLKFGAAHEVLGSDNGVGFATPLANGHGKQGWADQFLATPADGIEDSWVSVSGKLGAVTLLARYHDFRAETGGTEFGKELNLQATWKVNSRFTVDAKYAAFEGDDSPAYVDTDKAWLTLLLKL